MDTEDLPPWERTGPMRAPTPAAPPYPSTLHISGTGTWTAHGFEPWYGTLSGTISGPSVPNFLSSVRAGKLSAVVVTVFSAHVSRRQPARPAVGDFRTDLPLLDLEATIVEVAYFDPETGYWSGAASGKVGGASPLL